MNLGNFLFEYNHLRKHGGLLRFARNDIVPQFSLSPTLKKGGYSGI